MMIINTVVFAHRQTMNYEYDESIYMTGMDTQCEIHINALTHLVVKEVDVDESGGECLYSVPQQRDRALGRSSRCSGCRGVSVTSGGHLLQLLGQLSVRLLL